MAKGVPKKRRGRFHHEFTTRLTWWLLRFRLTEMHHLTGFTEWKIIVEIPMQEGVSGDMDAEDKGTTGWLQCTDTFAVFFCFFFVS